MGKYILMTCFVFMTGLSHVNADEGSELPLTEYEKLQIAKAIKLLLRYKVVSAHPSGQCLEVKTDLIQDLLNQGLLKKDQVIMMSICADGSN
jgi:hypothetical protein